MKSQLAKQAQLEYSAMSEYIAISYWADLHGFRCLYNYARRCVEEEKKHCDKIVDFITCYLGQEAPALVLEVPQISYITIADVAYKMLQIELEVMDSLKEIALTEAADVRGLIDSMIFDQIESVKEVRKIVSQLEQAGEDISLDWIFPYYSQESAPGS